MCSQMDKHKAKKTKAGAPAAGGMKPKKAVVSSAAAATSATTPKVTLNAAHTSKEALASYASAFKAGTPYPHIFVHDMFPDGFLQKVRQELLAGTYYQKRNDLYDFQQTDDLKRAKGTALAELRQYIYGEAFRNWIHAITNVPVSGRMIGWKRSLASVYCSCDTVETLP